MKSFTETEIKYLAGLLDADGSLSFKFCKAGSGKTFAYLILGLSAAESIDKQGYVKTLGERAGSVSKIVYEKDTYSDANYWKVQGRSELNMLLPRLTKHMVIKGAHWKRLFDKYTELKGLDVIDQVAELKEFSIGSRKASGPIKPKNHPTWAWVAGYLDGDGCYTFSKKRVLHVGAITHKDDLDGVMLLQKAFGGSLYEERGDNTRLWRRGLGKTHRSFAISFLSKVVKHSKLKKWKIEQMLAFHNQPQRLSDVSSTEQAIV